MKQDTNAYIRLEEERERLGFTRQQVASAASVAERSVARWERDTPMGSDKLAALAAVGFDVQYVLTGRRCSEAGDAAAEGTGRPQRIPLPRDPNETQLLAWWRALPPKLRPRVAALLSAVQEAVQE